MLDLTVARLSITPVKGLELHHPESVHVTAEGAEGDRLFYLLDDQDNIQSCTRNASLFGLRADYDPAQRRLEVTRGGQLLLGAVVDRAIEVETDMWGLRTITSDVVADPLWSRFFSDIIGKPVRLVQARGHAFDVQPVTLLGTGSIQRLAQQAALPQIDARRFRMLVEFAGGEPHVEDSWEGQLVEVGGAVLRGGGPIHRCAATTRNPESGVVDLKTLRLVIDYRGRQDSVFGFGANFGVYGDVIEPGTISVGDRLRVRTHA